MRFRSALFVSLLLAGACTPAPAPTPEVLQSKVQGTLNQVMRGILFPNSNIIFDAQDKNPGAEVDPNDPTDAVHVFHGTYGGWEAVENASMALAEAANLVALPGRTCANGKPVPLDDPEFQKGLTVLREVSLASYKAAQSKNQDAMLDIADKLTQACATCHDVYRDRVGADSKPIGIADRCVK
jgi:hypothetical protein